jgi:RNA polymerase sigma-70 factor (ECF subfamily)
MRTLINRLRSDEALMQAYQGGDSGAFECLYHRHKDGLFAFLYRSCPRHAVVEELAQDAWFAVVDRARHYRAEAQFKTWLYQIAHNRLVEFWRRRDNSLTVLDVVSEPLPDCGAPDREDLQARLMTAIAALPGPQRDALLLQEQGFSLQEIASITGELEETVKSRLRYARRQLRELLGGEL